MESAITEQQATANSNSNSNTLLPEFRGIFGPKGDSVSWLNATRKFPNGVPRFESKAECIEFMIQYNQNHGGSNPHNPHLMHIFTVLTSWDQIEKVLLPAIDTARKEVSRAIVIDNDYLVVDDTTEETTETINNQNKINIYETQAARNVVNDINFRLDLPIHQSTTPSSTMNTLKYLFFHMRCGIFVKIHNGQLRIFCTFVNSNYRNTWGDKLKLEGNGSLDTYYSLKEGRYREESIEQDKFKWWANGNIICNEFSSKPEEKEKLQHWGDHFLSPLRDMLAEACRVRSLPDCEFFLNKRDYPQLKVNVPKGGIPVEPYGFIYDKDDRDPEQDVPLVEEHTFKTYAPIVSFYAAAKDRFTDIPWPSSEDWEAACGLVFPNTFIHEKGDADDGNENDESWDDNAGAKNGKPIFNSNPRDLFTEENFRKFERGWNENRVPTAFFRGTATGGGTTVDNNQRLKVAQLSHEWKDDDEKGGEFPFLDAAIVGWNMRDKKIADSPMTFLRNTEFNFTAGKHHFTPIYEQSKYKYLVYVDGHCAACRYGFMMRLGSVILKVAPRQVADTMWYFPLLEPYVDHVPVMADLSDLEEKIRWCRENDAKCQKIGEKAKILYQKYVARDGLLDYIEMVCKQISKRYVKPPQWWEPPPPPAEPPKLRKPDVLCYHDKETNKSRLCLRCQRDADEEEKALMVERNKTNELKKGKKLNKSKLHERRIRKAKEAEEKKKKKQEEAKRKAVEGGKEEAEKKKQKINLN